MTDGAASQSKENEIDRNSVVEKQKKKKKEQKEGVEVQ